ncbi:MAG: sortase [Minisyncoccia bacterium]
MTNNTAQAAVWLIQAVKRAFERKWIFLGVFAIVFIGSIIVLGAFGLLPETTRPSVSLTQTTVVATSSPVVTIEEPVRIEIKKIDLSTSVANPTGTDIKTLDTYLLKGAVRYPTSAKLGQVGNVVIFGHSSYLPIVGNQAYKAFNGIQKLVAGDVIVVYSEGAVYTYRVRSFEKESSASGAGINLAVKGRVLTLATCDSFGAKTDRFVVTADFVESHLASI